MEPMTLGSPTNSPPGSPNVGYLPPFLLGEINSPITPRNNSMSPTKGRNLAFGLTSPTQTSTPDQKGYKPNLSIQQQSLFNKQNIYSTIPCGTNNISYSNKTTGPPIEDLYDTIKSKDNQSRVIPDWGFDNSACPNTLSQPSNSFMHPNASLNYSHQQNGWAENCQSEEHWITVFGFPPSTANTVLARFATCGTVLDKQYPTPGNWAHVRFSTRAEKERALALNGRQITPGIMVGVVNCKDPPKIMINSPNTTISSPERQTTTARPLCSTPLPSAAVPQRSNGLVSKAMEYVFGW